MVTKSYIWSMFTNNLTKNKPRSVNGEEKCHAKCCGDDHVMKEKNKPFIIHMNEMSFRSSLNKTADDLPSPGSTKVITSHSEGKMNENNSPPILSNYWRSMCSIFDMKGERIEESVNCYIIKPGLLLKMAAVLISLALIGLIVTSRQLLINNRNFNKTNENDNNGNKFYSEMTDATSSTASSSTSQTRNNLKFNSPAYSSLPSNLVASQNEQHQNQLKEDFSSQRSNIEILERINFYTTPNKSYIKVIPTLPSIKKKETNSTSEQNYSNECESTTLPLCQGKLTYDLMNSKQKWNITTTSLEYQHFQHLVNSNCSNRVQMFFCHILEPECRTSKIKNLRPCRRVCKGIFESCIHIIASSEILTEFFDCNNFIDSNDYHQCEDITRKLEHCYDDEFKCKDSSCIPLKWKCDNIRDCAKGEDEDHCKFCNYDEFKCLSDQQCISEKWLCDGVQDCSDGSDESNCDVNDEEDNANFSQFDDSLRFDYKDYNDNPLISNDEDKIVSTGDAIVPIFINPNSTITVNDTDGDSVHQLKRFRSTMRKVISVTQSTSTTETHKFIEESSISTTKSMTLFSSSHTSPCPEDHLRCIDGLCISLIQICDKIQDCSDNSDELHCEY